MAQPALDSGRVRVGIVGVGNCASSFIQGLTHYRGVRSNEPVPGLMNASVGNYHVRDIEIASAFDISAAKVGRDVAEAIAAKPNNTYRFADVRPCGVTVRRGPTLDGLGQYLRDDIEESEEREADVAEVLHQSRTNVVVSYLPVGSQKATEWYAQRAIEAGCAYVNCIPVFIASNPEWSRKFKRAGLPLVGDDIKSQVGATIVHRMLANLFRQRGIALERTYQLNFGGNSDFKNMLERERLTSKKISGGYCLRRRPAQRRGEARSVGFSEFRRRRHRCGPVRQTCHGSRHWRTARRAIQLLHEISATAVHR